MEIACYPTWRSGSRHNITNTVAGLRTLATMWPIEMCQVRFQSALSRRVRTVVGSILMALLELVTVLVSNSSASRWRRKLRVRLPLTKVSIWFIYIMFKMGEPSNETIFPVAARLL